MNERVYLPGEPDDMNKKIGDPQVRIDNKLGHLKTGLVDIISVIKMNTNE